ncbi:RNA-directed DNA polymerase (Reverse transcriptase), Ribonuclease H-like protein [Gossypium australe]|uniref:RNA-directed DNA polymerase (Reverse transcriptase), Ribonuclease H-like protein n=1 Tax=Gossypium australe TaxID=47621 RepID=A0A5B6U5D5_9ROSI|nr:RNA-directed DNA polymerase (Reverse transcriptase), Ribonuclease H-like protein [Gossypium australe]
MRTASLGKTSKQWRQEIKEEKNRTSQWEKKFRDAQAREDTLKRSLVESQNEKEGLKTRVSKLKRSLYQYRSRNSVIELKASLSKIKELKGKIEELETTMQNCSGSNPGDSPTNLVVLDLDELAEMDKARMDLPRQLKDHCKWLEEKFKVMETVDYRYGVDAKDLSLVPDLVLPPKFKTLEFEKYNETSCPEVHITRFCRRMAGYVNNNQLLIHCFQDSLVRSAAKCFSDIVMSGEMIENAIRCGKIEAGEGEYVEKRVKTDIAEVKTLMRWVWKEMIKRGLALSDSEEECEEMRNGCEFHNIEGHEIQNCIEFRALMQVGVKITPKVVIQKPAVFSYKDNKKVPWNYDCNVMIPREGNLSSTSKRDQEATKQESPINEPVKEEEAKDFLKFLKHSEYSVVEQLHKQLARISVLDLLLSSEAHRSSLMKVLNETYVANDISVNKLDRLISNISADNFIFFNDDEIPMGVWSPLKLFTSPPIAKDSSHMKACYNIVRVFDGSERKVMGRIEVPLLVGPGTYEVEFIVMDIRPSYNCLLGKPWIHSAGAVPSSLHQKLKLVIEGRLVTINAEEDIIATVTNGAPYLEASDEATECSFRSLEFVNATFIIERNKIPVPQISETIKMDLFSLRFKPYARQKKKELEKKQEKRKARLSGKEIKWEPMIIPHISRTFVSKGIIHPERGTQNEETTEETWGSMHINAISEGKNEEENWNGIRPYEPSSVLNNWTAEEILVAFRTYSESPDINDLSNTTNDSECPFEQDMCMEDFQDLEDDQGCDLSPELLRMVEQEEKQILPHKESVEIMNLGDRQEKKEVKIGACITVETKRDLIKLLQEFKDVFTWSYQHMPGLSTDIVVHRLPIKEEYKPVQRKLRRMRPDVLLKIKEEVKKQFNAGFLQVVKYSEWVANIVPVPKKDGKVRMCVDYRDLNKASPKVNFPLPHIDTLVDNTAGYSLFSFMDGFSEYNQIKMHPEDIDKTIFVTMWGMFCYKLKLNPAKCTFGTRSGNLLGFIVSKKGIEIDPDKVKAIQELPLPHTQKEVRGGERECNSRFLASRALEDYEPLDFDFPNEDLMYVATTEESTPEDRPWKLNFDGNRIGQS